MFRLSGIRLLALGIVLWAAAVWIFGTPHPASTDTAAATETAAAPTSVGGTPEPGADAGGSAGGGAAATPAPSTAASRSATPSPDSGTMAGSASLRTGSADPAEAAPALASAAPGDGTRIALAPTTTSGDPAALSTAPADPIASDVPGTGAGPAVGDAAVAGQINAARRAVEEGRLADALAHYHAAARIRPNLYVVWGEMGNVLWAMRRWPEAAYALEGAATLLIRAGEPRAASELVPAVEWIDPDAAYRVQQLLWAAAERPPG